MAVNNGGDATDDELFGDEAQRMRICGSAVAYSLHPVVVSTGTVHQTWHHHQLTIVLNGVARQCLTSTDEHLVGVLRIIKSNDVATAHSATAYTCIADEAPVAADTQAVTPTIHQHAVALAQLWCQSITIYGADGKYHSPETKHEQQRQGQGYQELRSLAHSRYDCCD